MRSRYTLLKDILKDGQWIFTCSMQPLQFSHFSNKKNLKDYDVSWQNKTKEEQDDFINDDFVTKEGSHHSIYNCSCKPISEKYALWFLSNKFWESFDTFIDVEKQKKGEPDNRWELYEKFIRDKAAADGIEFEGF